MVRRLLWPALTWVVASSCAAQGPALSPVDDLDLDQRAPARAPLLWRVQAPNDGPASHVFGTIHVGVPASELPVTVWRALASSSSFAMEADIESASHAASNRPAPAALSPDDRRRLAALVGPKRAQLLARASAESIYATVLHTLYPAPASMDAELAGVAKRRGLKVRFLEEWQMQLDLGSELFEDSELGEFLDPGSEARRDLEALIDAYRRGDITAIENMTLAPELINEDPRRFELLFFQRNRHWAQALAPRMSKESTFVAVGVGHLPGPRGLLDLLRARGFRVERISNPER